MSQGDRRFMCDACAPEAWPYECTACHEWKVAAEFQATRRELEHKFHRRCKACETCSGCQKRVANFSSFAVDTKFCTKCYARLSRKVCTVCRESLERNRFPSNQWQQGKRNLVLRCTDCHTCDTCHTEKDVGAFAANATQCIDCTNEEARRGDLRASRPEGDPLGWPGEPRLLFYSWNLTIS